MLQQRDARGQKVDPLAARQLITHLADACESLAALAAGELPRRSQMNVDALLREAHRVVAAAFARFKGVDPASLPTLDLAELGVRGKRGGRTSRSGDVDLTGTTASFRQLDGLAGGDAGHGRHQAVRGRPLPRIEQGLDPFRAGARPARAVPRAELPVNASTESFRTLFDGQAATAVQCDPACDQVSQRPAPAARMPGELREVGFQESVRLLDGGRHHTATGTRAVPRSRRALSFAPPSRSPIQVAISSILVSASLAAGSCSSHSAPVLWWRAMKPVAWSPTRTRSRARAIHWPGVSPQSIRSRSRSRRCCSLTVSRTDERRPASASSSETTIFSRAPP
ncbi:hypothetical protein [Streptomyces sp. NPDC058291]|uniref:hypothetical protein n=1 Tax=Streptomyces sp. NPDC058291 TaxID=3346427 RepID=UPI0036F15EAF